MKIDDEWATRIRSLVVALCLLGVVPVAFGQQAAEKDQADAEAREDTTAERARRPVEEVIVTGSRIQRPGTDTFYPAEMVEPQDINDHAILNIADALAQVPGFGNGVTPIGDQSLATLGQSFVDYLGLGSQRTLTVVDGRRFVSSNAPVIGPVTSGLQVDYNVLPMALVDRIEVIGVGGAPIYGSDAIAGTVNVIMKDRFEGLQGSYRFGTTEEGDGDFSGASLVFGANLADGRGNVAISAETYKQDGMLLTARRYFTENNPFAAPGGVSADGRIVNRIYRDFRASFTMGGLISDPANFLGNIIDPTNNLGLGPLGAFADGNFYQFDPNSNLVPYDPGSPNPYSLLFAVGGDGVDFNDVVAQARSELQRDVFSGRFNYDVTDGVRAFGDFLYSQTEAKELTNQGWFQIFAFPGTSQPLLMDADNPFLSQQARDLLAANGVTQFYMHRMLNDFVDTTMSRDQKLWRVVGGLEGDFEIANRTFNWEAYASKGESKATTTNSNIIDERYMNALDVRQLTAADLAAVPSAAILAYSGTPTANAGDIICESVYQAAAGNIPPTTGSGVTNAALPFVQGCVPLNLFGEGASSQAARDWATGLYTGTGTIEQTVYNVNLGGELFELPAGSFRFNVGYERRQEAAKTETNVGSTVPIGRNGVAGGNTGGSYKTDEVFAEMVIPLTSPRMGITGLELLELNGAVRHIDNSMAGTFTAWTAGGRYAPVRDITFRGNYTESLRAPSLAELFTPQQVTYSYSDDPCDRDFVNVGPDPATRRANCIALLGPGYDPDTFQSTIQSATVQGLTGGNPNLENETAKSYSVGITIQPRWVDNLVVTADYINIKLVNAIQSLDLTTIMQACYDSPGAPNVAPCGQFERDTAFQVSDFLTGQTNAARYNVEFMNYMVSYGFDVSDVRSGWSERNFGNLLARLRLSNTLKRDISVTGAPSNTDLGEFLDPKWTGSLDMVWARNAARVAYRLRWQPGSKLDASGDTLFQYPTPADPTDVTSNLVSKSDDWFMSDLSLSYDFGSLFGGGDQRVIAQLAINNLFDKRPDTVALAWLHYSFEEFLGRQFSLQVTAQF